MAGVLAAALREQRERTLSPPPTDDPLADWHPFQLRDTPTEPEPDAAPVIAPAYSISAIADAYRQRTMAPDDASAPNDAPAES